MLLRFFKAVMIFSIKQKFVRKISRYRSSEMSRWFTGNWPRRQHLCISKITVSQYIFHYFWWRWWNDGRYNKRLSAERKQEITAHMFTSLAECGALSAGSPSYDTGWEAGPGSTASVRRHISLRGKLEDALFGVWSLQCINWKPPFVKKKKNKNPSTWIMERTELLTRAARTNLRSPWTSSCVSRVFFKGLRRFMPAELWSRTGRVRVFRKKFFVWRMAVLPEHHLLVLLRCDHVGDRCIQKKF